MLRFLGIKTHKLTMFLLCGSFVCLPFSQLQQVSITYSAFLCMWKFQIIKCECSWKHNKQHYQHQGLHKSLQWHLFETCLLLAYRLWGRAQRVQLLGVQILPAAFSRLGRERLAILLSVICFTSSLGLKPLSLIHLSAALLVLRIARTWPVFATSRHLWDWQDQS